MKHGILLCALLTLFGCGPATPEEQPYDGLVIIGEKISTEAFDPNTRFTCEGGGDCLFIDATYDGHYRVLDVLYGDYEEDEIELTIWEHAPRVSVTTHKYVLLYLRTANYGYVLPKRNSAPLYKLKDGGVAGCGNPYQSYTVQERKQLKAKPLTAFNYAEPIRVPLTQNIGIRIDIEDLDEYDFEEEQEDGYDWDDEDVEYLQQRQEYWQTVYAPPTYSITDDAIECHMGLSPEDIFDAHWRASILPMHQYSVCEKELGWDTDMGWIERKNREPEMNVCLKAQPYIDWRD